MDHGVVMWVGDEGENWEVAWHGGYEWMAGGWPWRGRQANIQFAQSFRALSVVQGCYKLFEKKKHVFVA